MKKANLNDFIVDITQDLCEIESILRVLKNSVYCENNEIKIVDIGNTLEILIAKMSNTKIALDKYIDITFL